MELDGGGASRETIAQAAIRCFERFGVQRTSMADVAEAAGFSRQTVYRIFPSRSKLLEYIAVQRIADMSAKMTLYFNSAESLQEALVEGSLESLRVGREDALFREIVAKSGDHSVEQFMFRGSKLVQNLMLALWGPVLDKARAAGELRPGLTNGAVVEWIRNQHATLAIRDDYDEDARRRYLATFVVPSLVIDTARSLTKSKTLAARK